MKIIDKIKQDITQIDDPYELAGYLDGITISAAVYCKSEYPDEVIFEHGKLEELTVYGLAHYLKSEFS